jgi:hypothetical protein
MRTRCESSLFRALAAVFPVPATAARKWGWGGHLLPVLAGAWLAILLIGCAGYQLGPTMGRQAGTLTIRVTPFQNKTIEPRLIEPITHALRRRLQQDGTYKLDTSGDADVIVTGTILDYSRSAVAFNPNDTLTPQEYQIRITAQVTARERISGRVLLDRKVTGRTSLFVGADLTSEERQAIPLAADDLAQNATTLIVDGEW